jgi:hypothetical protein
MSHVSAALAAWREAERQLEATDDPRAIPALLAEVARLHEAYRMAIEAQGDVSAHGEPSDPREREEPRSH